MIRASSQGRRWGGALVVGLLLVTLAACGSSPSVTTITMSHNKPPEFFNSLIERFEQQNPDIRVVQDPHEASFIPGLVRGDFADVKLGGWTSTEALLAQKDVFEDLTDTDAAARIPSETLDLVKQWGASEEGSLAALPFSLVSAGVIYNKDIFAAHNLEVPATWSDFVELCAGLQSAGVTPIYGTFREPWTLEMPLDYAMGDFSETYKALRESGATLTADAEDSFENTMGPVLPQVEFIFDQAQSTAGSRSYPDGNVAFANGEAAMYLQGPWALSEISNANPDTNLGTFPLPMTDDAADTEARIILDLVVSIPKGTAHPEEARRFVEFLFEDEVNAEYNNANAAFSPLVGVEPPSDERIAGLVPYVQDRRFYVGVSAYFGTIPKANYIQAFALNRDGPAFMSALTGEWQRQAWRNEMRGLNGTESGQ